MRGCWQELLSGWWVRALLIGLITDTGGGGNGGLAAGESSSSQLTRLASFLRVFRPCYPSSGLERWSVGGLKPYFESVSEALSFTEYYCLPVGMSLSLAVSASCCLIGIGYLVQLRSDGRETVLVSYLNCVRVGRGCMIICLKYGSA